MDSQTVAVGCLVAGVVLVALAGVAFDPPGDRPMVVRHVDGIAEPGPADVTYTELPPSAQTAVDDAIEDGYASLSEYDDYAAVNALRGELVIRKGDRKYVVRTTSADGGHLAEALFHTLGVTVGGALVGTGAYVRRRQRATLVAVPVCAAVAVLGVNALAAPVFSQVDWYFLTSFGLSTAAPVIGGVAVQRRDWHLGALALGAFGASVGVLLLGDAVSALGLLVSLVLLALPGLAFGWRLDRAVAPSQTNGEESSRSRM